MVSCKVFITTRINACLHKSCMLKNLNISFLKNDHDRCSIMVGVVKFWCQIWHGYTLLNKYIENEFNYEKMQVVWFVI